MKCYFCRNNIDEYDIGEICITLNQGIILKKNLCKGCLQTLANGIIQCHKETSPAKLENHVSMMNSQNEIDLSRFQEEINRSNSNK